MNHETSIGQHDDSCEVCVSARRTLTNVRLEMLSELYRAMYGGPPPAMNISGSELWAALLARIAEVGDKEGFQRVRTSTW